MDNLFITNTDDPDVIAALGALGGVPYYSRALGQMYPPVIKKANAVRALISEYAMVGHGDLRDEKRTVAVLAPILADAFDKGWIANGYRGRRSLLVAKRILGEALLKPWVRELIPATA